MSVDEAVIAPRVPSRALVAFAALTFAISWSVIGGYVLLPGFMNAAFGEISGSHPLFFLATWAPGLAALAVVLAHAGTAGARRFLSRLLIWRAPWGWWLFILAGLPLVFMAGSAIKGGPPLAPLPPEGAGPMLAVMAMMLFLGPVEELGWRGVAQPILQRHMAPIWAGALIGVAWGLWHLPAFYLAGMVFAEWSFVPFFVGNVVLSILVAPILNDARGSLLLPVLFHWQLINPFWPDAQPWDTWILFGVATVVVWLRRDAMFDRRGAVTDVVPGEVRP
ncbi:CPBP family intramembrane glutamic endopeptidase [Jannaschia formosa]|uniref:CPBP family intramembrane glutamic endopeptidase n=1 Tax=Jannaschia formosa TaxID=2259592 RepID=UPI000E1C03DD|nr:CPBP family intramembrane glutamic endopeptidase [Jannaschia formosa]TFL16386.1 CPBP family intramembrane metalloprotease [Jannaschia formosa]